MHTASTRTSGSTVDRRVGGGARQSAQARGARRSLFAVSPFVDGFERNAPPPVTPRPVEPAPPGALSQITNQFMKRFFNKRPKPLVAEAA